jgi:hypothetical protein
VTIIKKATSAAGYNRSTIDSYPDLVATIIVEKSTKNENNPKYCAMMERVRLDVTPCLHIR